MYGHADVAFCRRLNVGGPDLRAVAGVEGEDATLESGLGLGLGLGLWLGLWTS